ncbi:hypothetical protein H8B06_10475 [Sphingobacterium sp. DN00404]|uniref:Uncharacterized protein n=1 Tax=Sphingobacterium micropteri TaxID=2763501 RepID=A0ABR7YPJ1_9SPHI|nr:hypothetical protein [Sphingobacterium micropteri]
MLPRVRRHSQEAQKYSIDAWKNSFPAHGNKREDHLYHFPGRIGHISVRQHCAVVRRTVRVVRRHDIGVWRNGKKVIHRVFVHVHVNACTVHFCFVQEQSQHVT